MKSPNSADFPFSDYKYKDVGNNTFVIKSYFDARNSFNAEIRSEYIATIQYVSGEWTDPDSWKLIDLSIDQR